MYCIKCGAELLNTAKYCTKCGATVFQMNVDENIAPVKKMKA